MRLDGAAVAHDAIVARGGEAVESGLGLAVTLNLAETIGAVDRLFDMAVDHAKGRIAFGRPIGSFQALKYVLADQRFFLEAVKAVTEAAITSVGADDPAAAEVVSMAAAYVGDVANDIAQECLQVHGGIGYTWEHDLHLYLRRIRSNSLLYGEPTWHRERVCTFHDLGATR